MMRHRATCLVVGALLLFAALICGVVGSGYLLAARYQPLAVAEAGVNADEISPGVSANAVAATPGRKPPPVWLALGIALVAATALQLGGMLLQLVGRGQRAVIGIAAAALAVVVAVLMIDRWMPLLGIVAAALAAAVLLGLWCCRLRAAASPPGGAEAQLTGNIPSQ